MAKHTKQSIIDLLNRNDLAVGRAMVVLYNRQTADEQSDETTKHHNGVGFSAYAAHSGTYFARWVLDGRTLTGKYLDRARKIAIRHAGQLVEEANEKSERMAAQLRHEAQVIASEERGMGHFQFRWFCCGSARLRAPNAPHGGAVRTRAVLS
jgi:hypothetical protein